MKLTKGEKKFIILLIIYGIIVAVIFLVYKQYKKGQNLYIITNDYKIKRENGEWQYIIDGDDYKLRRFDIYQDGSFFGNYRIMYSNHFILLDDSDNVIEYKGILWGTSGYKNKFINFELDTDDDLNDENIIRESLTKIDIDKNAYYSINQKIVLDIDNNGKNEIIYSIDNYAKREKEQNGVYLPLVENASGKNFAVLIMYKDNIVYIIDKNITKSDDINIFKILNIIDISKDNKYELVYGLGSKFVPITDCVKLYNLANEKEIHNFCK